jgi:hypothetical protein
VIPDTGVPEGSRRLGSISRELTLADLSFFENITAQTKGGQISSSLNVIEAGSDKYDAALAQFSGDMRQKSIDNVNAVRLIIRARGRPEDLQAWNDMSYIGIVVGKVTGHERAMADHLYRRKSGVSGGIIAVNENWFKFESPDHQLFKIAHEFRHTMYGNTLHKNIPVKNTFGSSGYERDGDKLKLSRDNEGDARRWAQEVLGYSDRDRFHTLEHVQRLPAKGVKK